MDRQLKLLVKTWLTKKQNQHFKLDGDRVLCQKCSTTIKIKDRRGSVRLAEHLKTPKHLLAIKSSSSQAGVVQSLTGEDNLNTFNYELFLLFASENVALFKLRSQRFRDFFLKHANQHVECATKPDKYISHGYAVITERIGQRMQSVPYAIYIDETQDILKRKVVNTIVVPLTGKSERPLLYDTEFVDSANKASLSAIVNRVAMSISSDSSLFKLLVTDQCRTNIAVGRDLKVFYKDFLHITCLAHGVHLLCETIREHFDKANTFVSHMKNVMSNSRARVERYRELTGEPLPPKPVVTRWGTFLTTAFYHYKHLQKVSSFVSELKGKSTDVKTLKTLVCDPELEDQLREINRFSEVPELIERLESRSITMSEQLSIVDSIRAVLSGDLLERFEGILENNPDFRSLEVLSEKDSRVFHSAVLCNAEVERSFSLLKNIVSERRCNLSESNVKKYLSIQFNKELLFDDE